MEIHDRLLLPLLQPKISGNPTVMLVGFAVALAPLVKLAATNSQPFDEPSDADLRAIRPAPDEIYDLVPRIMRNPDPG